jgi:cell division protein FtsB
MVDLQLQRLNNRPLRGKAYVTDREIIRWISIGAVFLTLILAYAWLQTEVMHVHYQMEEFQKKNRQLHEINAALRAEHSSLMDPEKINRRARELGLISSNRVEVRILESNAPALDSENLMAELAPEKKMLDE